MIEEVGHAMVHELAVMEDGVKYGKNVKIWRWSHVSSGTKIGDNVMIGEHVHIGPNVVIGDNVRIQNGVNIFEGVILEDNVFIGPSACFTNIRKPKSAVPNKRFLPTVIKKGASIGANSTIVCGVEVGENTMVGAGCVVHKSIPSNVTVVGNPARIIRQPKIKL